MFVTKAIGLFEWVTGEHIIACVQWGDLTFDTHRSAN